MFELWKQDVDEDAWEEIIKALGLSESTYRIRFNFVDADGWNEEKK